MLNTTELEQTAAQIRRDIVRMINGAKSGHTGGSLGCADFFTVLYFNVLKHNPHKFKMDGKGEDLFFLSNGHISPVLYSTLARNGYFPIPELGTFRKLNTRLQGHPSTHHSLPGIRMASGSLGQGLSNAIGSALGKKMDKDDSIVYTLHGDGELGEGQVWEAVLFAGAKGIDNLISTIDCNGLQIDGSTKDVLDLGDLRAKFESFKWLVLEMNGHNVEEIERTLNKAKAHCGKGQPIVILMKTEMGHGVDFMVNDHKWHGTAPNDAQLEEALKQLPLTLGDY